MKTTKRLRLLSLLGFLLLLAPFYDSCENRKNGFVKSYDEYDANGKLIEKTFFQNIYNFVVDDLSLNGFQIASFSIYGVQDLTFQELKAEISKAFKQEEWYKDLGIVISFVFDIIIVISFALILLTFFDRTRLLNKLALTNTILIILTLLYIVFLENSFEHWRQIKWGYYAFIITNVFIFYYSKLALKRQNL
jgi:heme/copper-type cytochrome/quinol oxidase subunit 4